MNFGGGYQSMGSYDQIGGGGYMTGGIGGGPSSSIAQSPGGGDRKGAPRNRSVRPVTSAQIHSAEQVEGDNAFRIDGEDVGQVVIVGEIIEVNDSPTNIVYKIDDRMGPFIEVRRWVEDESPLELQRRAACREGIYIKVIGHIRMFNSIHNVIGFSIKPIEDFNEVTHHLTEVLYTHLAIKKGLSLPAGFNEAQPDINSSFGGGSGWKPGATSTQMSSSYSSYSAGGGLDPVQKQVLSVVGKCKSNEGMHMQEIVNLTKNHGYSDANIKKAIDFLSNEGHIYSTIDDDHFKSTEDC